VGSVPTAYIFARSLKGIDIRHVGSGNIGATNAMRVLGKAPALVVLVLDMLKGIIAVIFVADLIASKTPTMGSQALRGTFGLASICGHNWTIFLNFKGGKGVATTFGVLLALAIKISSLRFIFAILLVTWLAVFFVTRIVSLASVSSAIALPITMIIFKQSGILIGSSVLIALLVTLRHKANLQRFLQGKENRF